MEQALEELSQLQLGIEENHSLNVKTSTDLWRLIFFLRLKWVHKLNYIKKYAGSWIATVANVAANKAWYDHKKLESLLKEKLGDGRISDNLSPKV